MHFIHLINFERTPLAEGEGIAEAAETTPVPRPVATALTSVVACALLTELSRGVCSTVDCEDYGYVCMHIIILLLLLILLALF